MMALLLGASVGATAPVVVRREVWEGVRWTVAEVDLSKAHIELVGQRAGAPVPHTLARTAQWVVDQGRRPLFATNAGIYTEDRRPLGLHIEAGVRYQAINRADGVGNFYLQPNGVFGIGPDGAAVRETSEVPTGVVGWTLATQSGPLLLRDKTPHPRFLRDSRSRKIRSWVGVVDASHIVLAVSLDRVRFHDTATFARDGMGCTDALYLDGTISEYWTPERAQVEGDPRGYGSVLVISVPAE